MECKLCSSEVELEISHIVPSFIFKWLKETSATGFIRCALEPNQRVQDGFKEKFLCPKCEDLFCVWETEFSKFVFHPLVNEEPHRIRYSEWMLKFSVSLTWRVIKYMSGKYGLDHLNDKMKNEVEKALAHWESFLLGESSNPGKYQQHVIPLDKIVVSSLELPNNINRYLLRSVDLDLVTIGDQAYSYIKLPHILIIGFIHIDSPNVWKGTKLHVKGGVLEGKDFVIPDFIIKHLIGQSKKSDEIKYKISEKQSSNIEKSALKDIDRLAISGTFKAMHGDVELHGKKVFEPDDS